MHELIMLMLEQGTIYELIKRLSDHEKMTLANDLKETKKGIETILVELDDVNELEYLTDEEVKVKDAKRLVQREADLMGELAYVSKQIYLSGADPIRKTRGAIK